MEPPKKDLRRRFEHAMALFQKGDMVAARAAFQELAERDRNGELGRQATEWVQRTRPDSRALNLGLACLGLLLVAAALFGILR